MRNTRGVRLGDPAPAARTDLTNEKNHAVFGFPDFGQRVFGAHQKAFDQAILVSNLANEMFVQTDKMPLKRERFVIYLLVRMAVTGWTELLILVGNGAGLGAMKISRGMFEAAVMAEYLRRTPEEIDDYLDFFNVLSWKRLQIYPDSFKPRQKKKIQTEYDRVKARFENRKGRVRDQWNKHSIRQMASVLGRKDQYDLPYSIAASMHHSNFEAMVSHVGRKNKRLYVDQPPSMNWVPQAFISGHVYLLQALETLNDCFHLGFDSRLKAENDAFLEAWGKKTNQSQ
jgi:hypothetical protein